MPTILTKRSNTPGAVPATANLTNAAGGAELAVNTADKRLFSINSSSAIIEVGTNPSSLTCADASFTVARVGSLTISSLSLTNVTVTSATVTTLTGTSANITNISGTSLTVSTATLSGGTANGVLYLNGSKVATSGSALSFDGTNVSLGASVTSATWGQFVGIKANYPGIVFDSIVGGGKKWSIGADAATLLFRNETDAASGMALTSTGLGIGTSSPSQKLHVVGGNARIDRQTNASVLFIGGAPSANYEGDIQFVTSNSVTNWRVASNRVISGGFTITPSTAAGGETFTTPAFVIDSSSNVGIGTSSPAVKLEAYRSSSGEVARFTASADGFRSLKFVSSDNTGSGAVWTRDIDSAYAQHRWAKSGTPLMVLDENGNLGIGTSSPGYKVTALVASGTDVFFADANNQSYGGYRIRAGGSGQQWAFRGGNDTMALTDVTAGIDRFIVNTSGNLFVGGTTGSARLNLQTATSSSADSEYIRLHNAGENVGYISWTNGNGNLARITGTKEGGGAAANEGILTFGTSVDGATPTERARITSGGYAKFSNSGSYYSSTGSYHELRSNAAAEYIAQIITSQSTGANCYGIRILYENAAPNGTTNPFWQCQDSTNVRGLLRSNGGLENYSANNVNIASDERLKKDIAPLSSVWGKVKDIEVVNYRYKDCNEGDPLLYGVIAQQVQPIVPDLVVVTREATETEPEYYGIREQPMYWLAIKALQEAMTRIEQLEAKVAALESK